MTSLFVQTSQQSLFVITGRCNVYDAFTTAMDLTLPPHSGRIVLIVLLVVVVIFTGVVGIGLLVHQRLYPKTKKGRAAEEAEDEETDPLTNPGSDSDELV